MSNYNNWTNENKLKNKLLLNVIKYIVFIYFYIKYIDEFDHSIQNTTKHTPTIIIYVVYFGLTTYTTVGGWGHYTKNKPS